MKLMFYALLLVASSVFAGSFSEKQNEAINDKASQVSIPLKMQNNRITSSHDANKKLDRLKDRLKKDDDFYMDDLRSDWGRVLIQHKQTDNIVALNNH